MNPKILLPLLIPCVLSAAGPLPDWDAPTEVIEWILSERSPDLQEALTLSYFLQLPGEDFPEATAALWEGDRRQTRHDSPVILSLWAQKDLEAAWTTIGDLLEIATENHLLDDWNQVMHGPSDSTLLERSPIWIERYDIEQVLWSPPFSGGGGTERARAIRNMFIRRYTERFGKPPWDEGTLNPSSAPPLSSTIRVLEAPRNEIETLLRDPLVSQSRAAVIFGLRRWAEFDPYTALRFIRTHHASLPENRYHSLDREIWEAWAAVDPDRAFDNFRILFALDGDWEESAYGLMTVGDDKLRSKVLAFVGYPDVAEDDWEVVGDAVFAPWITGSPREAFEGLATIPISRESRSLPFGWASYHAFYGISASPAHEHLRAAMMLHSPPIPDEQSTCIMEDWPGIDVGEAARFAVTWHLAARKWAQKNPGIHSYTHDSEHLINVWSGKANPIDGCMDDRAYGALRKWAVCQPAEMREWIATLEDAEIRAALLWLLENARGGFEPGTR